MGPTTDERLPDFARPLADQIRRRVEVLVAELGEADEAGELRKGETTVQGEFEVTVTAALERYRPRQAQDRGMGRLVFQPLYDEATAAYARALALQRSSSRRTFRLRGGRPAKPDTPETASDDTPTGPAPDAGDDGHWPDCHDVLVALAAAQVEALGPLRLSRNQTAMLATVVLRIGESLNRYGLLRLAAVAYDRAARLYLDNEDHTARDECLRKLASVRRRILPPGPRRLVQELNAAVVGYGFAPYRLLIWMAAQLAVAAGILLMLPKPVDSKKGNLATVYIALQDFINPMGYGDTEGLSHWSWAVLTVESYLGAISMSVFFALLLRKWFRV